MKEVQCKSKQVNFEKSNQAGKTKPRENSVMECSEKQQRRNPAKCGEKAHESREKIV